MRLSPSDRYQQTLFLLFLAFFAGSCVKPPYLQFLLMQHVPTILAALLLAYLTPSSGSRETSLTGRRTRLWQQQARFFRLARWL
jgi:hypothetical protein